MLLENRTVVVTGAARGLGRSIALAAASEGACVAVLDVGDTDETMAALADLGPGKHVTHRADVTDYDTLKRAVEAVVKECGTLDGLVNNAGLYAGLQQAPFDEIGEDDWDRMMKINVKGVWNMSRAVAPQMRDQGYGKIVNISSTTMMVGAAGMAHYVASKGAVFALTRTLARELGPAGVRVNTIMPGLTMSQASIDNLGPALGVVQQRITATTALGRMQQPDDLAGPALYLLSALSDAMTGQALVIDGGMVHW